MARDSDDDSDESDVEEAEKALRNKKQVGIVTHAISHACIDVCRILLNYTCTHTHTHPL